MEITQQSTWKHSARLRVERHATRAKRGKTCNFYTPVSRVGKHALFVRAGKHTAPVKGGKTMQAGKHAACVKGVKAYSPCEGRENIQLLSRVGKSACVKGLCQWRESIQLLSRAGKHTARVTGDKIMQPVSRAVKHAASVNPGETCNPCLVRENMQPILSAGKRA